MHNKQIEEALFPKDKIIHALQQEIVSLRFDVQRASDSAAKNETYANRYKELRAIGVLVVEEGTDPKYLKGEDMDAFFEGIGVYRGATPMTNLLAGSIQSLKDQIDKQILEKLYDEHTRS